MTDVKLLPARVDAAPVRVRGRRPSPSGAAIALQPSVASTVDFVWQMDALAFLRALPDASVDAVITDPPYPKAFLPLYEMLARESARILKPGKSLLAMCGQSWLQIIYPSMSQHLRYQWTLAYMTPGDSAQQWNRKVNPFWKPVLWFVNGKYNGPWIGDVLHNPANDKVYHHWGQSSGGIEELIRRFTKRGDLVCDPFMGGGTTAVAARNLGRHFVGCDISASHVETTRKRLMEPYRAPLALDAAPTPVATQLALITEG